MQRSDELDSFLQDQVWTLLEDEKKIMENSEVVEDSSNFFSQKEFQFDFVFGPVGTSTCHTTQVDHNSHLTTDGKTCIGSHST
jgi:hypothetical protein